MKDVIDNALILGLVSNGAITLSDCLAITPDELKYAMNRATEIGKKTGVLKDK